LAVGVAMLHLISLHPEKTQILQHSEDIVNKYIDGLPSKVYRTGGGYAMSLQEYLKHRGPVECIKIIKEMRRQNLNFVNAIDYYLIKHPEAQKVVKQILKSEQGVEEMFQNKVDELIQEEDKRQGRYDREVRARRALMRKQEAKRQEAMRLSLSSSRSPRKEA